MLRLEVGVSIECRECPSPGSAGKTSVEEAAQGMRS